MQSEIKSRARTKQIIDFKGIRLGAKGMPTDCDGIIEWHDKAYIIFEIKHGGKSVPDGQRLCFTRMSDDFNRLGKVAVFVVAEHDVDDPDVDIDAANCRVRHFYFKGKWYQDKHSTLKELIDRFINFVDGRKSS